MQDTVEKTDRQQLLEFRDGKPLKEVIEIASSEFTCSA